MKKSKGTCLYYNTKKKKKKIWIKKNKTNQPSKKKNKNHKPQNQATKKQNTPKPNPGYYCKEIAEVSFISRNESNLMETYRF